MDSQENTILQSSELAEVTTQDLIPFTPSFDMERTLQSLNCSLINMEDTLFQQDELVKSTIQPHLNRYPDLNPLETDYKLKVEYLSNGYCSYSDVLDKLFVRMDNAFTLTIKYKAITNDCLFLRVMILFFSPEDLHLPVGRCANHRINNDPTGKVPEYHILKCCHPDATYCGSEDGQFFKDRISILIPLINVHIDENGLVNESISFSFLCHNSCTSGINRRKTALVFTLESNDCVILGKKITQFKVCSCPKRDREKDEESTTTDTKGSGKRRKILITDNRASIKTESVEVNDKVPGEVQCTITLPNAQSMQRVLQVAQNELYGQLGRREISGDDVKKFIKTINSQLDQVSKLADM